MPSQSRATNTSTPHNQLSGPELLPVDHNVFAVGTAQKENPYLTTVTIIGSTLQIEIYTGSAVSLISQATLSKLWPQGKSPHLEDSPVCLRTNTGEEIRVVGLWGE